MQRRLALAPQLLGLVGLPHALALDHIALHHPFGLGDGIGIHGLGLDQIDGRALQRAGHADLVGLAGKNHRIEGADRHKLGPHRRAAIDGDRDFLARMALAHDVALAARHHVDRGILLIVAERHAVHRDGVAAAGTQGGPIRWQPEPNMREPSSLVCMTMGRISVTRSISLAGITVSCTGASALSTWLAAIGLR